MLKKVFKFFNYAVVAVVVNGIKFFAFFLVVFDTIVQCFHRSIGKLPLIKIQSDTHITVLCKSNANEF